MKKKIIAVLCALSVLPVMYVNAEYNEADIKEAIEDAIDWKEDEDSPLFGIGTVESDFYIMALKRLGEKYDYAGYLSGLDGIAAGYGSEHNASDMQRTALATIAAGGDAENVGGRDMIADATYYRNSVAPLDMEGVNGYSWALIALDAGSYETPDWALSSRDEIIAGILSHQNTDGSFDGDIYATASAVIALAPYYETSGAYTITQNQTGWTLDLSPEEAVDAALDYLSSEQSRDGDMGDLRSTAMTVIALDTLGIDAQDDNRFEAKNGNIIDGLMDYQNKDGGFSADLNDSDGEATSFALCALTSHIRSMQEKSTFFNFDVNDSVVLETPKPTIKPSTSSSSSSSNKTSSSSSSSKTSSSSSSSKTSSSSTTKATTSPKTTSKPASTLKPSKTTSPMESGEPKATTKPRATKKPDFIGPVEMPGPMPSFVPEVEVLPQADAATEDKRAGGTTALIIAGVVALLAIAGIIAVIFLGRDSKLSGKNPVAKILAPKNPVKTDKTYKAKTHRETANHRKFDNRKRFKQRKKYNKRRK